MNRDAIRLPNRASQQSLFDRTRVKDETTSFIIDMLEAIDNSFGLSIAIKLRYGAYKDAVTTEINPLWFNDAEDFADAYQSVKLLSKYPYLETGINKEEAALKSFREAESACLATNQRLRQMREGSGLGLDPAVQAVISIAVRKISHILGRADLDSISKQFGWGPGAAIGVRGMHTSAYNKFSGPLDVTRNCLAMGLTCINMSPSWANSVAKSDEYPSVPVCVLPDALRVVTGSEIIFVPKNAKTHRVIAIEPSLNGYVQKGFGRYIRKRLRERAGIDLNDQSVNQSLAQHGSRSNELATIDMSMASDTIARELVRELLPEEWYELLATSRCESGTIKLTGETVWFQKFSSMGNAYTFELESLIFYALSQACVDQMKEFAPPSSISTVSVYGDDIIVPVYCVKLLLEVLKFCGFTVNESKSYDDGPFRESCGKDFFLGTNVRPFFLKERIDCVEALFRTANAVRRYAHSRAGFAGCDGRFRRVWARLIHRIPKPFRMYISEGYGDGGLISNFDEACPIRAKHGWDAYRVRVLLRSPYRVVYKQESFGYTTHLFLARASSDPTPITWIGEDSRLLRSEVPSDGGDVVPSGTYTTRGRTRLKMGHLLVRGTWYNLGPWIM